jgi:hypothetical protein
MFSQVLGCLIWLGTIGVFIFLSLKVHAAFALGAVGLIAILMFFLSAKAKEERRRVVSAFEAAFEVFQGAKPTLHIGSSYGFPAFTITFASATDMNAAEAGGHIAAFKKEIALLYAEGGWEAKPFNVDMAVLVTFAA